jgi:hypothetical protein
MSATSDISCMLKIIKIDESAPRMKTPIMTNSRLSGIFQIYDGPVKKQPSEAINRPVIMICLLVNHS